MSDNELRNYADLPHSRSFQIHFCGHCENAHIVLQDETGAGAYMFVISPAQIDRLRDRTAHYNATRGAQRNPPHEHQ